MNLEKMVVQLAADFRPLAQGLAGATSEVSKTSSRINGILDGMNKAFGALGLTLSAGAFVSFTKGAMASAEALVDAAQVIGVTTQSLQELRYAAVESGGDVGQLDAAMTKFTAKLGDAANGSGDLSATFGRLGISVRDADGAVRSVDSVLDEVAVKIQAATSEQEKLAIATDAFGKDAAPTMVRMLSEGRDGLEAMRAEAQSLGIVMSDDLLRQTKEVNEEFDRLVYTIENRVKAAVVGVVASVSRVPGQTWAAIQKLSNVAPEAEGPAPFPGPYVVPYQPGPYVVPVAPAARANSPAVSNRDEPIIRATEAQHKFNTAVREAVAPLEEVHKKVSGIAVATDKAKSVGVDFGEAMADAGKEMAEALGGAILRADSFSDALGRVLQRLADIGMQSAIGSIFGDGGPMDIGGFFGSIFGGGKASGGPVRSNIPYLVGERGPELFVPTGAGQIVPNGALAGGGGGVSVSIAIDARGADAGAEQRLRMVASEIQDRTFNAVFAAMGRGGGYAKAAGRR